MALSAIDENRRLQDLRRYQILDTPPEQGYDDITELVAHVCQTPVALVTLIDRDRQWFKSKVGMDICEVSRDLAFCAYTILKPEEMLVIPDATQDPRFCDHPWVVGEPHLRFYAGCSLVSQRGMALGTLCTVDYKPRSLTPDQLKALAKLSAQVVTLLELRLALQAEYQLRQFKTRLIALMTHEFRAPLSVIGTSAGILEDYGQRLDKPSQARHHRRIRTSVTYLTRLMNGAIALDALENEAFEPLLETVDVQQLCHLLAQEIEASYDRQVVCLTAPAAESVLLTTDIRVFESVVSNILVNAVQHSPQDSSIHLDLIVGENALLLRIEDQGIGLPSGGMQALFPLDKPQEGAETEVEIGLNLSHSQRLAEMMGWQLSISQGTNQGTTACIYIPLTELTSSSLKGLPD